MSVHVLVNKRYRLVCSRSQLAPILAYAFEHPQSTHMWCLAKARRRIYLNSRIFGLRNCELKCLHKTRGALVLECMFAHIISSKCSLPLDQHIRLLAPSLSALVLTTFAASEVAWAFIPQYYTHLSRTPEELHRFYTKNSSLLHGIEGEETSICSGQAVIILNPAPVTTY